MSNAAAPSRDPPDDADPKVERAEQRLAMLRELADLAMRMSRDIVERASKAPADADPRHDPAESFARVSRAVRLTLALEARIEEDLAAPRDGVAAVPAAGPGATASPAAPRGVWLSPDHPSARRNRIRDNVWDVINHEINDLKPATEALDALHERLTEGERYDGLVFRPLRESVEAICADLGLTPDWSRWGEEGFPPDERNPRKDWPKFWRPGAHDPEAHRRMIAALPPDPHRRL